MTSASSRRPRARLRRPKPGAEPGPPHATGLAPRKGRAPSAFRFACHAGIHASPPGAQARSGTVDEVEALGDDGVAGLGVLPDRLGDDERHRAPLRLLLVD